MAIKLKPLGSRVVVEPIEQEEVTAGGIVLPETAKEKPQTGVVVAVGDDESVRLKVNDRVLFAKYSGTEFKLDGQDYLLMECGDVLARLLD